MNDTKYKGVISFWETHKPWERLQYLRDWKIYTVKGIHSQCPRHDWEDLRQFERDTIYEAHRKAVNEDL